MAGHLALRSESDIGRLVFMGHAPAALRNSLGMGGEGALVFVWDKPADIERYRIADVLEPLPAAPHEEDESRACSTGSFILLKAALSVHSE